MLYYLFSGINKEKGFTDIQAKYLKEDLDTASSIVFIASIPLDYERSDKQLTQYITIFNKIGIIFKNSSVIDKRVDFELAKKMINDADVVFLLGGSPELQMRFILEYDLADVIRKSSAILGVSAGSMNMCKRIVYKDEFDDFKMKDYTGLGISDTSILSHFDFGDEQVVQEAEEVSKIIPLILLPNDSFIRSHNGKIKIIGKYYKKGNH